MTGTRKYNSKILLGQYHMCSIETLTHIYCFRFAEMSAEEKNRVSHRANALCKLREWFSTHSEEL